MRRIARCTLLLSLMSFAAGTDPAVAGPPGDPRLERARSLEGELLADPARQKKRHNLEKLVELWATAKREARGSGRRAAAEGELRAWRLIARWSGRDADRARAAELERQLDASVEPRKGATEGRELAAKPRGSDAPKGKGEPQPGTSGKAREKDGPTPGGARARKVWLTNLRLEAGALSLRAEGELETARTVIPATGGRGARVVFDVTPAIAARDALATRPVGTGGVEKVRVGQFDDDTVRVVVDLAPGAKSEQIRVSRDDRSLTVALGAAEPAAEVAENAAPAGAQPEGQGDGAIAGGGIAAALDAAPPTALLDIVAELRRAYPDLTVETGTTAAGAVASAEGPPPGQASPLEAAAQPAPQVAGDPTLDESPRPAPEVAQRPPVEAPELEPPVPLGGVALKRSTREAAKPRDTSLVRISRVVIDAGHGGKDVGAIGKDGLREKDVNLSIALELGRELEKRLGVTVIYTRKSDRFISLERRAQIANNSGADLFISVHSNAHKKRSIAGIETYYLNTTSDRYATRLAARENGEVGAEEDDERASASASAEAPEPSVGAQVEDEGTLPGGALGRDLRLILADLAMRSASLESRRLAGYIQSTLVGTLRRKYDDVTDLGVKHALFYVLLGARMPSVLIETGFVTNPKEAGRLADAKYRREAAAAIARGVERFVAERNAIARRLEAGAADETLASARR